MSVVGTPRHNGPEVTDSQPPDDDEEEEDLADTDDADTDTFDLDMSDDEEDEDEEWKILTSWQELDVESMGEAEYSRAMLKRNRALLTQLLDLESPFITQQMEDFLGQEGVPAALISFVHRGREATLRDISDRTREKRNRSRPSSTSSGESTPKETANPHISSPSPTPPVLVATSAAAAAGAVPTTSAASSTTSNNCDGNGSTSITNNNNNNNSNGNNNGNGNGNSSSAPPLTTNAFPSFTLDLTSTRPGALSPPFSPSPHSPLPSAREFRLRRPGNVDDARRSFRAVQLLIEPNTTLTTFVEADLDRFLTMLFRIFEPTSRGNFHHLKVVLDHVMEVYFDVVAGVFEKQKLMEKLLRYVHESPVPDIIVSVMQSEVYKMPEDRRTFFLSLGSQSFHFFLALGCRMYGSTTPDHVVESACRLFRRLLDEMAPLQHADLLFRHIVNSDDFLGGLFAAATGQFSRGTTVQERETTACIRAFLEKTKETLFDRALDKVTPIPLNNSLDSLREDATRISLKHAASLLTSIIRGRHASHVADKAVLKDARSPTADKEGGSDDDAEPRAEEETAAGKNGSADDNKTDPGVGLSQWCSQRRSRRTKRLIPGVEEEKEEAEDDEGAKEDEENKDEEMKEDEEEEKKQGIPLHCVGPFSTLRLDQLTILAVLCESAPDQMLDVLPTELWDYMSDWLFHYDQVNIFHSVFYRMTSVALERRHAPSLERLLVHNALVERMIVRFQHKPVASCHGMLLLLLNKLRLMCDLERECGDAPTTFTTTSGEDSDSAASTPDAVMASLELDETKGDDADEKMGGDVHSEEKEAAVPVSDLDVAPPSSPSIVEGGKGVDVNRDDDDDDDDADDDDVSKEAKVDEASPARVLFSVARCLDRVAPWAEFVPILIEHTMVMTVPFCRVKYQKTYPLLTPHDSRSRRGSDGVGLGSQFANALGVGVKDEEDVDTGGESDEMSDWSDDDDELEICFESSKRADDNALKQASDIWSDFGKGPIDDDDVHGGVFWG
eukprot:TRINITY_DN337_c0_g4_i1.p1 TRINITY_DN337_c0_g4~~TRINITY_DN337_c0_g4_i1.p1  ORF type:complete len:1011 (-),score=288.97 TRINITY_DN337_c0_g4_i1:50-3082(-)